MAKKNDIPPPPEKRHSPLRGPTKTFQQDGHWIVKPSKTPILTCVCGNRYLKTRPGQDVCLRCLFSPKK